MPLCGCFHNFDLVSLGHSRYRAKLDMQGYADVFSMLEATGIAKRIRERSETYGPYSYHLLGVEDFGKLESLCEVLKSCLTIDLSPEVDFCYAFGPYTLFEDDDSRLSSKFGELIRNAKYLQDRVAIRALGRLLLNFIHAHPILNSVTAISFPPKSQSELPDVVGMWGVGLAKYFGWNIIRSTKTRITRPQKELLRDDISESDTAEHIRDSIAVYDVPLGSKVLALDDTMRSGGSLLELARALRRAGASNVYGLVAAKTAKFTRGGVSLYLREWI